MGSMWNNRPFSTWIATMGLMMSGLIMWLLPLTGIAFMINYNISVAFYPWHLIIYFIAVPLAAICGAFGAFLIDMSLTD